MADNDREIALGERWAGRMEQRLIHVEQQLADVRRLLNWALGVIAGVFLMGLANWVIGGGLATVAQ